MNLIDYIEHLAERHVDIRDKADGHIHFLSSERARHTSIDSVLRYPAVIVDRGGGFDYGGSPGQYTKTREYLLFIVDHVADTSDYAGIDRALSRCESILEQVEVEYVANHDNQQYGVMAALQVEEPYKPINCKELFT